MINTAPEGEVTLLNGRRVPESLFIWINNLLGRGHVISVDADGNVFVHPPIDADTHYCLSACYSDTRDIVRELTARHVVH